MTAANGYEAPKRKPGGQQGRRGPYKKKARLLGVYDFTKDGTDATSPGGIAANMKGERRNECNACNARNACNACNAYNVH